MRHLRVVAATKTKRLTTIATVFYRLTFLEIRLFFLYCFTSNRNFNVFLLKPVKGNLFSILYSVVKTVAFVGRLYGTRGQPNKSVHIIPRNLVSAPARARTYERHYQPPSRPSNLNRYN